MKYSVFLYIIAILAGPIHSAFGDDGFEFDKFQVATEGMLDDIEKARGGFDNVKINGDLMTPTLVKDYQTVQEDAENLVSMAGGKGALSAANQKTLHDDFNQVTSKFSDLLETTGADAGDFEVNPDQANIQTAANNAESEILDLFDAGIRLAPTFKEDIEMMKGDVEQADTDMNNEDADSPLRRRKVSRAFRA